MNASESEDDDGGATYRTVVRDEDSDPIEVQRNLDAATPGFATAIDVQHRHGARPADALPELMSRTAGATVRSIGGLGQFSALSLRGSSPQQVAIFMDGVPLGDAFAGLVDIGAVPLDGLDRITIYRGYVPIAYGSATMGGAVDLIHRPPSRDAAALSLDVGYGSFGARQAGSRLAVPIGDHLALTSQIGYAGARGNFPFLDPGTPLNADDDRLEIRDNNHYDRVLGQLRVDARHAKWRLAVHELVSWRRRGIPGPVSRQTRESTLANFEARTIASARRTSVAGPGGHIAWVMSLAGTQRTFTDPRNEIGLGVDDERTVGVDGFVSARLRLPLWQGAFVRFVGDHRVQWMSIDERVRQPPGGDSERYRLAFAAGAELEQFLFDRRWLIVPAIRVDAIDSRFDVPMGAGQVGDEGRDELTVGVAPRLGTRVRLTSSLELRATVGRYFRPPTLLELFGDRGFAIGNEALQAERGTSVDGGLVGHLQSSDRLQLYGQIAGFYRRSENLIQWVNAGPVTRPENIPGANIAGVETGLQASVWKRTAELRANYTFLHSENRQADPARRGNPLPGRPRHSAFVRVSLGHEWVDRGIAVEPRAFHTTEVIARTFLDPSARFELPPRAIQGLGFELVVARRVRVAAELRNFTNVRSGVVTFPVAGGTDVRLPISDFIGYPLPGRSVWLTLRVQMQPPGMSG